MALTATATKATREHIIKSLNMHRPSVIAASPQKPNIIYSVGKKIIADTFEPLVAALLRQGRHLGRVIVFCRTYVTSIYMFLKRQLKEKFTYPPGAPDLARFRLVDMYTRCTHDESKGAVIEGFTSSDSHTELMTLVCE